MVKRQRIMIIAWGTRGDLQPVTALALRLKREGREVMVFATPPATDILEANGIEFVAARENVADFIKNLFGMIDISDRSFLGLIKLGKVAKAYTSSEKYVSSQKADMETALATAREFKPDLLITPTALYGPFISIAEALKIPSVTLDLQINYPTSEYPLYTMEYGTSAMKNRMVYRMKSWIYPPTIRSKFNTMRDLCSLPRKSYANGAPFKIWPHDLPQMCAVSPSLCPQPKDWPKQKMMSGWLTLPKKENFEPPLDLAEFVKHEPVYIGFGSMIGTPEFCTSVSTLSIKALKLAGRKGVLLGGWAGLTRDALDVSTKEGRELYEWAKDNVFEIDSCPHDWLFPQCAAAVHHGGAGTLASSIRAGCPSIVCAIIQGDQPFHGSLSEARGLGRYVGLIGSSRVTSESLSEAISEVISNPRYKERAKDMSESVRHEDGVGTAVAFLDDTAANFEYPWPMR